MSVDSFKPEVWNAGLLSVLEKALVLAGVSNRNYEGDIANFGDTVHITAVDDVSIVDYTPNSDLPDPEVLDTTDQTLVIDKAKAFNFYVDDVDARQVRNDGALLAEAGQRAAFGLRDKVDLHLRSIMAGGASNHIPSVDASSTAANVYDKVVVPASVALDEANVPEEMRWLAISPATYGKLQLDDRFVKAAYSGTGALHTGYVGDAGGLRIMKSNNLGSPTTLSSATVSGSSGAATLTSSTAIFDSSQVGFVVTGTGVATGAYIKSVSADGKTATLSANNTGAVSSVSLAAQGDLFIAGSTIATTFAQQILKTVAYSPEKRFGDAIKGLHVWGAKVVRAEALVSGVVKNA